MSGFLRPAKNLAEIEAYRIFGEKAQINERESSFVSVLIGRGIPGVTKGHSAVSRSG